MNLFNMYAFILETQDDDNPGNMAEMYEKYIKGKEFAWKDLEWSKLQIIKAWATKWGLNQNTPTRMVCEVC
jgi:hypothetical protein